MVRRRIVAEELRWRQSHTGRCDKTADHGFVPALEIAGIYRDLRKGLEDAKNEPGAADSITTRWRCAGSRVASPPALPTIAAGRLERNEHSCTRIGRCPGTACVRHEP